MSNSTSHSYPFLKARCKECGHQYLKPYRSNFDYGEIVFQTEAGEDYAYWYLLYDPLLDEINSFCKELDPDLSIQEQFRIIAYCADQIRGKRLTILHCPSCGSTEATFWHDNLPHWLRQIIWKLSRPLYSNLLWRGLTRKQIPFVTFEEYNLLDGLSRNQKITESYQEIKTQEKSN